MHRCQVNAGCRRRRHSRCRRPDAQMQRRCRSSAVSTSSRRPAAGGQGARERAWRAADPAPKRGVQRRSRPRASRVVPVPSQSATKLRSMLGRDASGRRRSAGAAPAGRRPGPRPRPRASRSRGHALRLRSGPRSARRGSVHDHRRATAVGRIVHRLRIGVDDRRAARTAVGRATAARVSARMARTSSRVVGRVRGRVPQPGLRRRAAPSSESATVQRTGSNATRHSRRSRRRRPDPADCDTARRDRRSACRGWRSCASPVDGEKLGLAWRIVVAGPATPLVAAGQASATGTSSTSPVAGRRSSSVNHISHVDPFLVAKWFIDAGRTPRFLAKDSIVPRAGRRHGHARHGPDPGAPRHRRCARSRWTPRSMRSARAA